MPSETRGQKSQEGQQKQPAGQSDSSEIASLSAKMDQLMGVMTSLNSRVGELEAKSRPPSPFLPQPIPQIATVPGQSAVQPVASDDKRWRPEEVGIFNGTGDVMAFIDRIRIVAANKSVRLVQTNITTVLKETAFNWYRYELEEHVKLGLNTSTTIEP